MTGKKYPALLVSLLCFIGGGTAASIAASENVYAYELAEYPTSLLSVNGNTANCISYVTSGRTESIEAAQTLQRYDEARGEWADVPGSERRKTEQGGSLSLSSSISGLSAGKYRLVSVFELTCTDGEKETVGITTRSEQIMREPASYPRYIPQQPPDYGKYVPTRRPTDTVEGVADFAFDNSKCTLTNLSPQIRRMTAVFMVYAENGECVVASTVTAAGGYGASVTAEIPDPRYLSERYHYRWKGFLFNGEEPGSGVKASFDRP